MKTQKDFLKEFIITHENNHHRPYGDVGHQIGTNALFYSERDETFYIKFKKGYNNFVYVDVDENLLHLKTRMYNKNTGTHDIEIHTDKLSETDSKLLDGIISPFRSSFLNYKLQQTFEMNNPVARGKLCKI
ncbi:MAG: hypothetical protein WBH52_06490 [Pseudomonas aeruginosa]